MKKLIIPFEDNIYTIEWWYSIPKGETLCLITIKLKDETNQRVFSLGTCEISKKDTWNKEAGKKTSLTRALQQVDIDKKSRTIIWKAYFEKWKIEIRPKTPKNPLFLFGKQNYDYAVKRKYYIGDREVFLNSNCLTFQDIENIHNSINHSIRF